MLSLPFAGEWVAYAGYKVKEYGCMLKEIPQLYFPGKNP
jgi:hypothetical protein